MKDADARARIARDLATTFVVEAAAGTGKTTALVSRIVYAIASGHTTLDRIVAVTFTEKAAGEMRLRLRSELDVARAGAIDPVEGRRVERAISALETARIGTIHGFCADLLRERPIEARVDPMFEQLDEDSGNDLLRTSFERWFESALASPPEGLRRALRRKLREGESPREMLFSAVRELAERRDFKARYTRIAFDREARVDALVDRIAALGARAGGSTNHYGDYLLRSLFEHRRLSLELRHRELDAGRRDYELLEAMLVAHARTKDAWEGAAKKRTAPDGTPTAQVIAERDDLERELSRFVEDANADLAACLRDELFEVIEAYDHAKGGAGRLDFLDLLTRARDLLRGDARVLAELRARFDCFFVDEVQDVDPVQADILLLLASRGDVPLESLVPGKLFMVGDPKQSIYRFRRADVSYYTGLKLALIAAGAEVLYLATSFRARPEIQSFVNLAFAGRMQGEEGQADYVPLEAHRDASRLPAVIALPVPRPYGKSGRPTKGSIAESCPDAVGAFVEWLLNESGMTVREAGADIPIESRHVCLLFRQLNAFWANPTHQYVHALEARGIPHVIPAGTSWGSREEVVATLYALMAIEWPDDELAVYATLRGAFLSIADRALLAYRETVGKLDPLRPIAPDLPAEIAEVGAALELLRRLHYARNRRPIEATLADLFESTRAHVCIAIRPGGEQALSNLLRTLEHARRFEARGATSFRAFVEWLDAECASVTRETLTVEEGTPGVRISTVHAAKGLEFPVVVLCDPTVVARRDQPSRYVDAASGLCASTLFGCVPRELLDHAQRVLSHDHAEEIRLAYVAATRAKEMLVVPVVGDERVGGWVDVFHDALYPSDEARRSPTAAEFAAGFGDDSVLERTPKSARTAASSVAPGLHIVAGAPVAWWDPRKLRLGVELQHGDLLQDLLGKENPTGLGATAARHEAWKVRRADAIARGSIPTARVQSVTEVAHALDGATFDAVPLERVTRLGARPRGKRFGSLVHAILEHAPLDGATVAGVEPTARAQARVLGASEAEIAGAIPAALAALEHPVMRRAARATECHREMPLAYIGDDGAVVEGVVDLAFVDDTKDVYVLVDFKTDANPEEQLAYRAQLALYAKALREATGKNVETLLLAV